MMTAPALCRAVTTVTSHTLATELDHVDRFESRLGARALSQELPSQGGRCDCGHDRTSYSAVPVGTWKRDLTGKGNADKAAVMAAVRELGYVPETQDEADALGILRHSISGFVDPSQPHD